MEFTLTPQQLPFLRASWLAKVNVAACADPELPGPCWEWRGARTSDGYAVVRMPKADPDPAWAGKLVYLHRLVLARFWKADIVGLDGEHLCRNRSCFQPHHLEPLTHKENVHRSTAVLFSKRHADVLSELDITSLCDTSWAKLKPLRML